MPRGCSRAICIRARASSCWSISRASIRLHAQVTEKPGGRKLSEIKLMKDDAAGVEAQAEEIKARYAKIFGV